MKNLAIVSSSSAVMLVGLVLVGCGAAPESNAELSPQGEGAAQAEHLAPEVGAPGEGRDVTGLTLGPVWTEAALSAHGGGGGGYTGHITPTAVIYGVQVRSGAEVDAISVGWYQPSQPDNFYRSGDAWGWTPFYGGGGGGLNAAYYCPAGKGVIGIRGNSGAHVDRIGVICGDVPNPDPNNPSNSYSPLWGGGGGGWFGDDKCTASRLVSSFNVRSGALLDNIQAICINAF